VTWIKCELKAKAMGGNGCSRGDPKITDSCRVVFLPKAAAH